VKAVKALAALLLAVALVFAVSSVIILDIGTGHASTACPQDMTCITGKLQVRDPGSDTGPQFTVEDKNGAPMAWVNLYGLYSGGDGGLMPGGLVCVTYKTSASVACLTPEGDLTLTPAGKNGPAGPARTLTPADINWLHKAEKRGLK
jgi:hypothetical protein